MKDKTREQMRKFIALCAEQDMTADGE